VHKKERGYHNYALPYSWDVRLGHKEKKAALAELDDEIDLTKVTKILDEIGYKSADIKPHKSAEERLIAYYVAPAEIQKNTLQKHLLDNIPKEYVPSQFVWMKALPINTNGKVDRQALPKPKYNLRELITDYIPPVSKTEEVLVALWSKLLGVKEVGTSDNFFDLGGDSIVNIQIVAAAREKGIDITPQQIFDCPTISELSAVAGLVSQVTAQQSLVTGDLPLLPSQHRFFEQKPVQINAFNQSVCLQHNGKFNTRTLNQALQMLITHHDGLRTQFSPSINGWKQSIQLLDKNATLVTEQSFAMGENETAEINKQQKLLNQQIDIQLGKLVVAKNLIFAKSQRHILLIAIHHLVIDGVSWWVLLNDLESCCKQILLGNNPKLSAKSCSVQQWSKALVEHVNSKDVDHSLSYWTTFNKQVFASQLFDFKASKNDLQAVIEENTLYLDKTSTDKLMHEVPSVFSIQLPEVLMTAFLKTMTFLQAPSATQQKILIDIEGHGREALIQGYDVIRTVSWFTSVYPALLDIPSQQSLGDILKSTKEHLRRIPKNGVEYGILRYLSDSNQIQDKFSKTPKANVLFNYMGQWERTLAVDSQFKFVKPIEANHAEKRLGDYALELNAMIFEDRLQVSWTYDENRITDIQIKLIEKHFIQQLQNLIDYCLSGEQAGLTPADFKAANIQQDDLDDILSEFGEE
jgi:non-ribosomal peptide synthase protein (TIGR01720 family)